jgi:hypothetical protein
MKLGIVATDIRGSVGGTVFSRNLGGAYTRARVAPVNRNTPKQTQVRANFGTNSKMWSGVLTADQRAAWTLFAQNNPLINVLGASIIVSGIAMFNKLNQRLTQIGAAPLLDAPSDLSVDPVAEINGVNYDSVGQTAQLATRPQTVVSSSDYYIFATGPLAPGRTPPSSSYRYIAAMPPSAAADITDFTAPWVAIFGAIPQGASIGTRVATISNVTGAITPPVVYWSVAT